MGQYYVIIFLKEDKDEIEQYICPGQFREGIKLLEHSYQDSVCLKAIEYFIGPQGKYHKCRIVWAGDYADPEENNLYNQAHKNESLLYVGDFRMFNYRYIVNHTTRQYVDKTCFKDIHPLPLLTAEGNGLGSGDYYGVDKEMCGIWARNVISMEREIPEEYIELKCNFAFNN
jgi:hypothetical protein